MYDIIIGNVILHLTDFGVTSAAICCPNIDIEGGAKPMSDVIETAASLIVLSQG